MNSSHLTFDALKRMEIGIIVRGTWYSNLSLDSLSIEMCFKSDYECKSGWQDFPHMLWNIACHHSKHIGDTRADMYIRHTRANISTYPVRGWQNNWNTCQIRFHSKLIQLDSNEFYEIVFFLTKNPHWEKLYNIMAKRISFKMMIFDLCASIPSYVY